MANRPAAANPLSPEDRQLIRSWLTEFSQTWSENRLGEAVAALLPASDRLRLPALLELVKIDLRRRWELGQRIEVEAYLSDFPELGHANTISAGLVKTEYEARQKAGTDNPLEEITTRFPRQAAQLMPPPPKEEIIVGQVVQEDTVSIPPAPAAPAPTGAESPSMPERIGRYRLLRKLGQGGMGSVYLARDEQLDREVALKVPKFDPEDGPLIRQRFLNEAKAAAALHHPNVCAIFEIGEAESMPFLSMAYIDGRPLTDYIDRKGISPTQAALLVRKVALALKEAHKQGIVHRDLKPGNIMLDQRKEPIVMDFGLARLERQENSRLTKLGVILGTPTYMAPEQVAGDRARVGPRSDIYSLGIILYEMLAGRPPFAGVPAVVLGQVLTQPAPPPSEFRKGLDAEIEAVCMKAIARRPEDRYSSMEEFAAALNSYLKTSGRGHPIAPMTIPVAQIASAPVATVVQTTPPPIPETPVTEVPSEGPRRGNLFGPLLAVSLAGNVLLVGALVWALTRTAKDSPGKGNLPTGASLELAHTRQLTVQPGQSAVWEVTIRRKGFTGPVEVKLEDLPAKIAATSVKLNDTEETAHVEVVAAIDAPVGNLDVKIVAESGEVRTEEKVQLIVQPGESR